MLKNWILETRQRENPAGSAQDEEGNNLLEKAQTYVATLSSGLWGKAFKINNYVVTVHNFSGSDPTDGKDWFYIHQENIHDGRALPGDGKTSPSLIPEKKLRCPRRTQAP